MDLSEKVRSLFNFLIVFIFLIAVLAVVSPEQFEALREAFSQIGDLLVVLLVIAVIVFVLRKVEEI